MKWGKADVCKILHGEVGGGRNHTPTLPLCPTSQGHGIKLAGSHSETQKKMMFFHRMHYQTVDYRAQWHAGRELVLIR